MTLKILQYKVEIIEPLAELAKEYEKLHPNVKIEIETAGGGIDYSGTLRSKFAAEDYPDIFNCGGYQQLDVWINEIEDLSDQPWVPRLIEGTATSMTKDGKIFGMPLNLEGYGFIYNKDLFEKAGIAEQPKTYEALVEAVEKLKAHDILPFSNGYQEWWVLGYHSFNSVLSNQENPDEFIREIKEGSVRLIDNEIANNWIKLLDLTVVNGQPNPLVVDYNTQVTEFAKGNAAMMQQGNWIQVQIDEIDEDIRLGILPYPVLTGINDKIHVDVPHNWVVYNKSPVKDIAKDFLNWMVSSETGLEYFNDECKFISPFEDVSITSEQLGDLAMVIEDYMEREKVLGWHWTKLPEGSAFEIGYYTQSYIGGSLTKEQLFEKIEKIIRDAWNR